MHEFDVVVMPLLLYYCYRNFCASVIVLEYIE